MSNESREQEAMAFHLWRSDLAAKSGMSYETITYAWTGEFREDGVLVPAKGSIGFGVIPAYSLDHAVGVLFAHGFVVHHLFYSVQRDRYAVVETVWAEEPDIPGVVPIGKPAPEGTAPLRWLEEEELRGGTERDAPMVAWARDDVPRPLSCRAFPEDCTVPLDWMPEEEVRQDFPHLIR